MLELYILHWFNKATRPVIHVPMYFTHMLKTLVNTPVSFHKEVIIGAYKTILTPLLFLCLFQARKIRGLV
jgi:hypothetical protein